MIYGPITSSWAHPDMSAGFHFVFGDDSEDGVQQQVSSTAARECRGPATLRSTHHFPWLRLTQDCLQCWGREFPTCSPSQQLAVELPGVPPSAPLQLRYQCSVRVPQLEEPCPAPGGAALGAESAAKTERCDIIPGRYYGGLKVWSCAIDLAHFLWEQYGPGRTGREAIPELPRVDFQATEVVVEVGCGQGIPGILALLLGARHVVFQDYNEEVLRLCVQPNIAVNVLASEVGATQVAPNHHVQLVHGDWAELASAWPPHQADGAAPMAGSPSEAAALILGSDVTFDELACHKLAALLERSLRQRASFALIATKDYYFGTNGGLQEFTAACHATGFLRVTVVHHIADPGAMQRSILLVQRRAA